jgi:hypothetical protein
LITLCCPAWEISLFFFQDRITDYGYQKQKQQQDANADAAAGTKKKKVTAAQLRVQKGMIPLSEQSASLATPSLTPRRRSF